MKKSVVWISVDRSCYELRRRKPRWGDGIWCGGRDDSFCHKNFERLFPFFTMPMNSLGKITNTANTLTFEIVETK